MTDRKFPEDYVVWCKDASDQWRSSAIRQFKDITSDTQEACKLACLTLLYASGAAIFAARAIELLDVGDDEDPTYMAQLTMAQHKELRAGVRTELTSLIDYIHKTDETERKKLV